MPYLTGASTVFADRLLDLVGLGVMILPSACFVLLDFSPQAATLCLCACVITGGVVLFFWGGWIFLLLYMCIKRLNIFVSRLRKKETPATDNFIISEVSKTTLLRGYAATLLKFSLVTISYWAFAQSLGMCVNLWTFLLIVPIIQIFFLVSFTVGGAGFIEAGWYLVLNTLGTDAAGISTYLVAQRLFYTLALVITVLSAYGSLKIAVFFQKSKKVG